MLPKKKRYLNLSWPFFYTKQGQSVIIWTEQNVAAWHIAFIIFCSGTVLEGNCYSFCDRGGVVFGYDKEKIYIWASQRGKHSISALWPDYMLSDTMWRFSTHPICFPNSVLFVRVMYFS